MSLLTQGRPGAGSLRVRKTLRGVADGLEFFAPSGAQQRESRKPLCTASRGDGNWDISPASTDRQCLEQSGCLRHSDRHLEGRDRIFREIRNADAVDDGLYLLALVCETAVAQRRGDRSALRGEAHPRPGPCSLIVARDVSNHTAIELAQPMVLGNKHWSASEQPIIGRRAQSQEEHSGANGRQFMFRWAFSRG